MSQAGQSKRKRNDRRSQTESSWLSKKQKLDHQQHSFHYPPQFFDNLSQVFLTKEALRELNRRNNLLVSERSPVQHKPPVAQEQKGLKLFARHGGPDLQDLRGYTDPAHSIHHVMSSSQSNRRGRKRGSTSTSSTRQTTTTTITKETGTSGAYNRNFQQHLVDHGIYPDGYEYPDGSIVPLPNDWEEFNRALVEDRASLSPSQFTEERFREFRKADAGVVNEGDAMRKVVPLIQGTKWDERRVQRNVVFGNFAPLTDGTLKNARPDLYYGGRPEQLPREIRRDLGEYIVPSTSDNLPIAPNMFLEAKGPDGSAAVAQRQACYDGALGSRGIHELLSYRKEEQTHDNKIKAVSSVYHNGQLKMYTHHIAQPNGPGSRPAHYMNQVRAYAMTDSLDSLKAGLTGFRNSVEWADKKRNEAISYANAIFDLGLDEGWEEEDRAESIEGTGMGASDTEDEDENEDEYQAGGGNCLIRSATPQQMLTSFTSPSLVSTFYDSSRTDDTAQEEWETSTDELALHVPLPAKRSSRSQHSHKSKRQVKVSGRRITTLDAVRQGIEQ